MYTLLGPSILYGVDVTRDKEARDDRHTVLKIFKFVSFFFSLHVFASCQRVNLK